MRPNTLLVLAGGFGTRLRSVVSDVPKPLAPVAGKPFLHYLVESWVTQKVNQMIFLLHYEAGMIELFLKKQKEEGLLRGCKVKILTEPKPLGTGGAVAYAVREFEMEESFLVANADTWLGSGVQRVARTVGPAIATVKVNDCKRYGRVQVQNDRVVGFEEKDQVAHGAGLINAGLYHLQAGLFRDWKGNDFSLEKELFPQLATVGGLQAVHLETSFIDIGVPEDYFRFSHWISSERVGSL